MRWFLVVMVQRERIQRGEFLVPCLGDEHLLVDRHDVRLLFHDSYALQRAMAKGGSSTSSLDIRPQV